eukprot:141017_1
MNHNNYDNMEDNKYDTDSDADGDYKEVVVNNEDFRKEIFEFDFHRDLPLIKCIGQIESEFNYKIKNNFKVSAVGTGTVYKVVDGNAFILSCAHNIRLKIYECAKCNTFNRKRICSKCGNSLQSTDKKLIKPTYTEFKRRTITEQNFGRVERSYKCEEIYVPKAYESNFKLEAG